MPAPITKNQMTDFWHANYVGADGLCGLCGNHGVIDTRGGLTAPNGRPAAGGRFFCVCPNGQAMKRGGYSL